MTVSPAILKDEALVAEMDGLLDDQEHFYLWWLGQSGFLLQWQGKRALIDPYLSESLTEKYRFTDKPHTRISEPVIKPHLLKGIAVVSSSHNHTDHLDAATLLPVLENNPGAQLVIPEANRGFVAERLGCDPAFPLGLNAGDSVSVNGFKFFGLPAKHNEVERDEQGNCRYMGYVIRFGNKSIYHSGDTLWLDELVHMLDPMHIDVALLPINGNDPARRVAGNLDCREAAEFGKAIRAGTVIPCHYDLFSFNTADVNEFARWAGAIRQPYHILRGGEGYCGKMDVAGTATHN